jgi:hypothetical protein
MKRVRKTLKKYFIPHEENDHKPHILRTKSIVFVLVVALAVEGAFWFGTAQLAPRSELFGIIVANTLIDETNQNRVAANEPKLAVSPLLDAAAQEKANDMVTNNYFAHTSPAGLSPWYWFEHVGYNYTYAGENLAVDFSNSQDVTDAWMNSPDHRANILNTNFTQIGMAAATGTFEGHPAIYVVELFGAPAPEASPAEPIALANTATPKAAAAKISKAVPEVSSTNEISVAVKGAETQASTTTIAPVAIAGGTAPTTLPQSSPIQNAAANPRTVADDIYLAIIALFALALGINIFVKIRIQHPQVIFGGMLVILIAGLLIVLNQHLLGGAAIL